MPNVNISISDKSNNILCKSNDATRVSLLYDKEYVKGDVITLSVDTKNVFLLIQLDDTMEPTIVFCKDDFSFTIPFDEDKFSYSEKAFSGNIHVLKAEIIDYKRVNYYRNLAFNPYDHHKNISLFPHSSANVETRGEAVFASRNAINGNIENEYHGKWPYESWGINKNPDALIKIDFGRDVLVDKIILFLRADFPHDSYWNEVTFTFSDNTTLTSKLSKTRFGQEIILEKKKIINFITMDKLIKADDESPFPALTQIEVYGTEIDEK